MNIPITILPNKNGSFTVISNALNFVTEGDSLEEAMVNAKEAADCHLEGLKKLKDKEEDQYLEGLDHSFNSFVSI